MHGRKYRNAALTCDVVFANSAFTADDFARTLDVPARAGARRASRDRRRSSRADGPVADLGAPYLLTVATLEPRKNLGTLVDAFALLADTDLVARRRRRRRAGASSRSSTGRGIVRLGRVTDEELARLYRGAAGGRLPVALRGLRHADHRGDGVGRARRRLGARVDGRGVRRRRGARRPREPEAIAAAIREALARRDELRARGLEHAAAVLVAAHRRGLPGGIRAIRVALDTTPLRQTRAGTARYVRALRDHLDADVVEVSYPATSRLRTLAADVALVPAAARAADADVLHCPTFRGPFRARDSRSSSPCTTSRCCGIPSGSTAGRARTRAFAVPRVVARGARA